MSARLVGASSGLDYDVDVRVEGGLLTCGTCGRLPGYFARESVGIAAASQHLGSRHRALLEDVEGEDR